MLNAIMKFCTLTADVDCAPQRYRGNEYKAITCEWGIQLNCKRRNGQLYCLDFISLSFIRASANIY